MYYKNYGIYHSFSSGAVMALVAFFMASFNRLLVHKMIGYLIIGDPHHKPGNLNMNTVFTWIQSQYTDH
jgi:hypothetical protein